MRCYGWEWPYLTGGCDLSTIYWFSNSTNIHSLLCVNVYLHAYRDAQWETEEYFGELLDDSKYCQAENCQCPDGRGHHTKVGYVSLTTAVYLKVGEPPTFLLHKI